MNDESSCSIEVITDVASSSITTGRQPPSTLTDVPLETAAHLVYFRADNETTTPSELAQTQELRTNDDDNDAASTAPSELAVFVAEAQAGADVAENGNGNHSVDHNDDDDDDDKIRAWKASPFAVGLTHATWADEGVTFGTLVRNCTPVHFTAWCCGRLPCVGRVGNMVVLWSSSSSRPALTPAEEQHVMGDGNISGNATTRQQQQQVPKLICVVGPYWMVLCGLTLPLISLVTFWTAQTQAADMDVTVLIVWIVCTAGLYISLLLVACSNPGIMYRHAEIPTSTMTAATTGATTRRRPNRHDVQAPESWYWNDQALTFRPHSAKYDPECAAVIEAFDHTCPWTGTAIGRHNMLYFKCFVTFIAIDIVLNAAILSLIPVL